MYCKNCGKENNANAYVCLNCGVKIQEEAKGVDNPSHLAGVASCCFPIVGIILYFIWRDTKPKSAKLICNWMLGGIGAWVLMYILFFIIGMAGAL